MVKKKMKKRKLRDNDNRNINDRNVLYRVSLVSTTSTVISKGLFKIEKVK